MRAREVAGYAALAAVPALAIGYALAKAQAAPAHSLARFRRTGSKPVVACVGASLIRGRLSFDVVGALAGRLGPDFEVVNAGVNGDLAWNVLRRLDAVVGCDPDYVILLVGTNDVLASDDGWVGLGYRKWKSLPVPPTLDWYRENLESIVYELRARTRAQIAVTSLPPLGEALDSPLNRKLALYNTALRSVARDAGVEYIPFYEDVSAAVRGRAAAVHAYDGSPLPQLRATFEHYVLGRTLDAIARERGNALLVDGVHLSSSAGALLATRFEAFVRRTRPSARSADSMPP